MTDGLFQPMHLMVLLFSALILFGGPFLAGYFLGRYVELKKSRQQSVDAARD